MYVYIHFILHPTHTVDTTSEAMRNNLTKRSYVI